MTRTPAPTATATTTELPKLRPGPRAASPAGSSASRAVADHRRQDVECDGNTQFNGAPDVGSLVDAIVEITPEGRYIGLSISRIGQPDPTPSPFEFTDVVCASTASGEWPQHSEGDKRGAARERSGLGDTVEVKAQSRRRRNRGPAHHSHPGGSHPIQGIIESMNGNIWVVDGKSVIVDGRTEIAARRKSARPQVLAIRSRMARSSPVPSKSSPLRRRPSHPSSLNRDCHADGHAGTAESYADAHPWKRRSGNAGRRRQPRRSTATPERPRCANDRTGGDRNTGHRHAGAIARW